MLRRSKLAFWTPEIKMMKPVSTAAILIIGMPLLGVLLTVGPGSWAIPPDSISYQWNADGVPISGKTTNTFGVLALGDVGKLISVTVTANNSNGSTSVTSNSLNILGF